MRKFLVDGRRLSAVGRVAPSPVVEDLDVLVDGGGHLVAGRPAPPVDELLLQGSEEALNGSVVPAIAATTEAAFDAVVLQGSLVVVARVLRTAIRMLEEPRLRKALTTAKSSTLTQSCATAITHPVLRNLSTQIRQRG